MFFGFLIFCSLLWLFYCRLFRKYVSTLLPQAQRESVLVQSNYCRFHPEINEVYSKDPTLNKVVFKPPYQNHASKPPTRWMPRIPKDTKSPIDSCHFYGAGLSC